MTKRLISILILIVYIAFLLAVLVFKELPLLRIGHLKLSFGGTQEGPANLIPFKTILPYLLGYSGLLIAAINILGNIILFLPIGFLLPFIFPRMNWKSIFFTALASGFIIEGVQATLHIGIFDIDDVILNGLGVILGYWAYNLFSRLSQSIKHIKTFAVCVMIVFIGLPILAHFDFIQLPISLEKDEEHQQLNKLGTEQSRQSESSDLCNGSGGTGQIVLVEPNAITIKRNDGNNELVKITDRTAIKTSEGKATQSVLKVGDRVTVIIDESETAAMILVCNLAATPPKK